MHEIKRIKAEPSRVTDERDILKKATAYFAKVCFCLSTPVEVRNTQPVSLTEVSMPLLLYLGQATGRMRTNGFLGLIKQFWLESCCVAIARSTRIFAKSANPYGCNHVDHLMKLADLKSRAARSHIYKGGRLAFWHGRLQHDFDVQDPN